MYTQYTLSITQIMSTDYHRIADFSGMSIIDIARLNSENLRFVNERRKVRINMVLTKLYENVNVPTGFLIILFIHLVRTWLSNSSFFLFQLIVNIS